MSDVISLAASRGRTKPVHVSETMVASAVTAVLRYCRHRELRRQRGDALTPGIVSPSSGRVQQWVVPLAEELGMSLELLRSVLLVAERRGLVRLESRTVSMGRQPPRECVFVEPTEPHGADGQGGANAI